MLIRYIFGPRCGETEHVDRAAAKPLILGGFAEACNPDDLKDPNEGTVHAGNEIYRLHRPGDWKPFPTTWSVELVMRGNGAQQLAIVRVVSRGSLSDTVSCSFHPDSVHDRRDSTGRMFCSVFGCPVPENILAEYHARWKATREVRATEEKKPVVSALDAKADKAAIERGVEGASAHGLLEGQRLVQRPGPRT